VRGGQEVGGRLEFGKVRVDGVEVEVNPSKGRLVHHVGANEQVFRVLNSALDKGGNGMVLEKELERKERAWLVLLSVVLCWCSPYHVVIDLDVHGTFFHNIPRVLVFSTTAFDLIFLVFWDRWKELFKVLQVVRIVCPYNEDYFVEHSAVPH
jgi:hypothetical protein